MTLVVPDCASPKLSVLMVTHGAWELIERACAALIAHTAAPFELIVIDNASDQQTRAWLSQLRGARLTMNEQNVGFGPACNQGAKKARGEYLVLLNTDAFVQPGWLEPLLEALDQPAAGVAVPRYLNPDGSLQEAGVLLARDGSVLVYGDGDDPGKAFYRFRRPIDYASAVCMVIRTDTFTALGGFDDRFAPAYYEDADLCLRLAQRGQTVWYEPRSTVTHVRYGSGDRAAALRLSDRNRRIFVERWGSHLAGRPPTFVRASAQAAIAARDALAVPRVLICSQAQDPVAERVIRALLDLWPSGRVTWVAEQHAAYRFDPPAWLALGIEVLDQDNPAWLDDRLFHYDVVAYSQPLTGELVVALDRTQPQAPRIRLEELDNPPAKLAGTQAFLATAGITPVAELMNDG